MKKVIKVGLIMSIILSFSFSDLDAQAHKWQVLGKRKVNMKADHDEIPVTVLSGTFTSLKFMVLDAPIFVKNIRVFYGNGTNENFVVNKRIPKGHFSRVIDLKDNKRIIKKININYSTIPNFKGRAEVIVLGRH